MEPLPKRLDQHGAGAILLLTKSFASWLNNDNQFLDQFIRRLVGSQAHVPVRSNHVDQQQDISIFMAVVDRVPMPSPCWIADDIATTTKPSESIEEYSPFAVSNSGVTNDKGFEGLAYCASAELPLLHGLIETEHVPSSTYSSTRPDISMSSTGTPALSFRLFDHLNADTGFPVHHTTVTLPLANTIFYTGQPSLASLSRWRATSNGQEMIYHRTLPAADQAVYVPAEVSDPINRPNVASSVEVSDTKSTAWCTRIAVPLQYLVAEPLQIAKSMGNVVTKVSGSTTSLGERPASQELEAAVAEYYKAKDVAAERLAVWALIIPKSLFETDLHPVRHALRSFRNPKQLEPHVQQIRSNHRVADLILRGATLRRVLSGGGGWGVKAGMLSIDPDADYSQRHSGPDNSLPSFMQQGTDSMVQDVTSPGDTILFFAAPESEDVFSQVRETVWSHSEQRLSSLDFGVIPSTVDDLVADGSASVESNASDQLKAELYKRHFGALSESGLCVSRSGTTASLPISSKVDVPYARLSHQVIDATALRTHAEKVTRSVSENARAAIRVQNIKNTLENGTFMSLSFLRSFHPKPYSQLFLHTFLNMVAADLAILQLQLQIVSRTQLMSDSLSTPIPLAHLKDKAIRALERVGVPDGEVMKLVMSFANSCLFLGPDAHRKFGDSATRNIDTNELREAELRARKALRKASYRRKDDEELGQLESNMREEERILRRSDGIFWRKIESRMHETSIDTHHPHEHDARSQGAQNTAAHPLLRRTVRKVYSPAKWYSTCARSSNFQSASSESQDYHPKSDDKSLRENPPTQCDLHPSQSSDNDAGTQEREPARITRYASKRRGKSKERAEPRIYIVPPLGTTAPPTDWQAYGRSMARAPDQAPQRSSPGRRKPAHASLKSPKPQARVKKIIHPLGSTNAETNGPALLHQPLNNDIKPRILKYHGNQSAQRTNSRLAPDITPRRSRTAVSQNPPQPRPHATALRIRRTPLDTPTWVSVLARKTRQRIRRALPPEKQRTTSWHVKRAHQLRQRKGERTRRTIRVHRTPPTSTPTPYTIRPHVSHDAPPRVHRIRRIRLTKKAQALTSHPRGVAALKQWLARRARLAVTVASLREQSLARRRNSAEELAERVKRRRVFFESLKGPVSRNEPNNTRLVREWDLSGDITGGPDGVSREKGEGGMLGSIFEELRALDKERDDLRGRPVGAREPRQSPPAGGA